MGVIFLPSLMEFADICLDMCAESVSDMSVAHNTAVGAGGNPRFPTPYSVDVHLHR